MGRSMLFVILMTFLILILVIPVVVMADNADGGFRSFLTPFVVFGASIASSFVAGKIQKNRTPIPNDVIPATNTAMMGTGAGVLTQDPLSIVAAVAGSLTSTAIHQLWKKVVGQQPKKKPPSRQR